jgi:hypothetical protein
MDPEPALAVLKRVATERGLPAPVAEIGSGSEGVVFSTADPSQVCRVGTTDRVTELMEWQHTHAVVQVFYVEQMEAEDSDGENIKVWVSWQERVDEHVEGLIYRMFGKGKDREGENRLLGALSALYHVNARQLKILKEYEETSYLAEAIEEGLPVRDLSLESNLGVTSDGRVVAFDL